MVLELLQNFLEYTIMATPKWNDGPDNWNTASDWSTDAVPAAGDDVTIAKGNPQINNDVGTVASVTVISDQQSPNTQLSLVNGANLINTGEFYNGGILALSASVTFGPPLPSSATLNIGGALTNSGSTFIEAGPGKFLVGAAAAAEVTASSLVNTGSISVSAALPTIAISGGYAALNIGGQTINDGSITLNDAASIDIKGAVSGSGSFYLNSKSVLEFGSADNNNVYFGPEIESIYFRPTTLRLDAPSQFTGTIFNFGEGDVINLSDEVATSVSYSGSIATVTLADGSIQTFKVTGNFTSLTTISDGNKGTNIVVCFAAGTRIGTARGDVAVEELREGDLAVTSSGALRPITWTGSRLIECSARPTPFEVWPERVRADAFGRQLPKRDLFLSPGHPVLVGDHLVPIMCLINGTSIARVQVDKVIYWHVELDAHDILLAEGLPAESYLDWGDRAFFAEGSDHALHNPDFIVPGLAGRCRPVALDGPVVEVERRRLDAVFATSLALQCAWPTADGASFCW